MHRLSHIYLASMIHRMVLNLLKMLIADFGKMVVWWHVEWSDDKLAG